MNAATIPHHCKPGKVMAGAAPEYGPRTRGKISLQPLRILLVDDDPSLRDAVADCLRRDGHTVETAEDGVHGLEVFCAGTWEMVLVDRAMPRMSGFELAFAIKQRNPHMPVVLISGFLGACGEDGDIESAVDIIVPKPFGVEHLREGMARALEIHRVAES